MSEPRQIAVVQDYDGLVAAFRARADELNVSRATIDDVSGLQSGYAAKLLATPPIKNVGAISLGPLLGALGVSLIMVEDPEAMARVAARMSERDNSQVRMLPIGSIKRPRWLLNPNKSKKFNALRSAKLSDRKRQKIARKAARVRWRKARKKRMEAKRAANAAKDLPVHCQMGAPSVAN